MTYAAEHLLVGNLRILRMRLRVSRELDALDKKAKEIAADILWATGEEIDVRTVQNALAGISCNLDTYDLLIGTYGLEFRDRVEQDRLGGDYLACLEREIASEKAKIAARDARLAAVRSARLARGAVDDGSLRLLAEEDRGFRP